MPQDNGLMTVGEIRARYGLGARTRPPDPREWKYELKPSTAVDRSVPRSLGQYAPRVKDQESEGSCTANAGAGVQETCAAIAGLPVVPLSREWIYYQERVAEGTFPQDAGAYVADEFDTVLKNGGCPAEADWPYDANPSEMPPAGLDAKPKYLFIKGHQPISGQAFVDGMLTALDNKQPLSVALDWLADFDEDFSSSGVLRPNPTMQSRGAHNIYLVCFTPATSGRGLLFGGPNSWGPNSPAHPELDPYAASGWIWFPEQLFTNGVVSEVRAAVPVPAQPAPGPTPTPQPVTDYKAQAMAACIATMNGAIQGYQQSGNDYLYWRGEYDGALFDYNAIARL